MLFRSSQQPLGPHSALFEDKDAVIVDERDRTPRNKPDWLRDFHPPPQPHWHVQPTASAPDGSSGEGPLSIGSVGHPENCAIACRYRRRKGGCRLGTSCPQCHLCFWQRSLVTGAQKTKQQIEQQEETREQLDSQPSAAQKENLQIQAPLGFEVPQLEVAAPQEFGTDQQQPQQETYEEASAIPNLVGTVSALAGPQPWSVGSMGHPERCGKACKYARRKTGCHLGASCPDCHACQWRRDTNGVKQGKKPEQTATGSGEDAKEILAKLIHLQFSVALRRCPAL